MVPWDKFSPDHLVGVIPDDLNFDASIFPCCSDHRPRFPSISRRTTLTSSSSRFAAGCLLFLFHFGQLLFDPLVVVWREA